MNQMDALKIIKYPHVTEKASMLISRNNTLTFIVDSKANKRKIKQAVETLYNVKVDKVNVLICKEGKKAYVRLSKEYSATDLASKIGIM